MIEIPSVSALLRASKNLGEHDCLTDAVKIIACLQAREIAQSLPRSFTISDPGGLHDARVAGRRLRAAMYLFRELYPATWQKTGRAARAVVQTLRAPRDLDVRTTRLHALLSTNRKNACAPILWKMLEDTGNERARHALPCWARPVQPHAYEALLPALWRPSIRASGAAGNALAARLRQMGADIASQLGAASVEKMGAAQHRLRIMGKELRYSLEMLVWKMGKNALWRIDVLRKMQDELGELHDIDVFVEYLGLRKFSGQLRAGLEKERHTRFENFCKLRGPVKRACSFSNF